MEKKLSINQPTYKWQDLTIDIQNYFIVRVIGIIIALIVGIFFGFTVKNAQITFFYYAITILYTLWTGNVYLKAIYDKIYIYEGICEKKSLKKTSVNINGKFIKRSLFTLYGRCNATMVIENVNEDGKTEIAKFIVPIGYEYDIDETNMLRVYAFENSILPKNDNTFIITNPLIVKVAKN